MTHRILSLLCAFAFALLLPVLPLRAEPPAGHAPAATQADPLAAFREPQPGLLTGGQPDAAAWPALAARGVRTVINLRPQAEMGGRDEAAEVAAAGLRYVNLPVAGAADITPAQADALWAALQGSDGAVLVHCASGNRVGALLALAMQRHGGMTPEQALAFGRAAGLKGLEPVVRERLGVPPAEALRDATSR
ncbi:beta-lactamase hydrolase domain-containing protein [Vulcaniibacterium gelatinicum]|uniref:beta-lactamase hydrolase domain-containing protein n=1 Tax=Vulcaniibacterium gelatinicum TaxID=2598725 RepID=UPI0011C9CE38|nr:sulfur transferase domain-containing protein [Vulcaniibacterium gelatinicum]